jgi:DNA-directed RNA polymerase subunit RPC12/RpoP
VKSYVEFEISDDGRTEVVCKRSDCRWWHVVETGDTIEDVNTWVADHWSGHIVEVGDAVLRVIRETVDDLRLRVVEILSDAQRVPSTPQDPVMPDPEPSGSDTASDPYWRLQDAHRDVWTCADCGSDEVISGEGVLACVRCGYRRLLDPIPETDQVEIVGLPDPDTEPTTGAPKLDDAGFERPGEY